VQGLWPSSQEGTEEVVLQVLRQSGGVSYQIASGFHPRNCKARSLALCSEVVGGGEYRRSEE
jgi:hypothetical protein